MRPTKLTEERAESIFAEIAKAAPKDVAARANGIEESTLHSWQRKGKKVIKEFDGFENVPEDHKHYMCAWFMNGMWKAEAEQEIHLNATIQRAADEEGKWQAAAWLLERKHPERYAAINRHEIGQPGAFDPEKVAAKAQELAAERLALEAKKADADLTE